MLDLLSQYERSEEHSEQNEKEIAKIRESTAELQIF